MCGFLLMQGFAKRMRGADLLHSPTLLDYGDLCEDGYSHKLLPGLSAIRSGLVNPIH